MINEQNQVQETVETTEEGFFDDLDFDDNGNLVDEPEEVIEEPKEEVVEEVVEETTEEPQETKPFLEVQYNKEVKGLTQEEAKTLAQKGMNYDKMLERYNSLNNELDALARRNGLTVEDYLVKLQEVQINSEIENELESLTKKYPDTSEEVLRELATQSVNNRLNIQAQNQSKEIQEKDDALLVELNRQAEKFQKEYPNLNPDTIPKEVIDMWKSQEYTLLEAYNKWAIQEANKQKPIEETKQKVIKQNEENKRKSLGSIDNVGNIEGEDDFFSGFESALR